MEVNYAQRTRVSGSFPNFGAIFMSNSSTKEVCFEKKLFGLPAPYENFVKKVKVGMILFLFEYKQRKLYGVFEAASDGAVNIVPHAYGSTGKQFSAQVRIRTIWQCHPLSECDFRGAIEENYFAPYKFNFGLSRDQVQRLLWLFYPRKGRVHKSQHLLVKNKVTKQKHKSLGKRKVMEKGRSSEAEKSTKKLDTNAAIDSVTLRGHTDLSDHNSNSSANSEKINPEKNDSPAENQHKIFSGDPIITSKQPETIPFDCSYDPEASALQCPSDSGITHSFVSIYESGNHSRLPFYEKSRKLKISASEFSTDLGDYIPLPSSPDYSDPEETGFPSSEADCLEKSQVGSASFIGNTDFHESYMCSVPVLSCGSCRQEDIDHALVSISLKRPCHQDIESSAVAFPSSKMGDCHLEKDGCHLESQSTNQKEHLESNYDDVFQGVKGLYSDTLNKKSSVFSRLNFTSGSVVPESEDDTRMDTSVQEIMEKLQKRHDTWTKKIRKAEYIEHKNEDNMVKKRASVFSRLNTVSKAAMQEIEDDRQVNKSVHRVLKISQKNHNRRCKMMSRPRFLVRNYGHSEEINKRTHQNEIMKDASQANEENLEDAGINVIRAEKLSCVNMKHRNKTLKMLSGHIDCKESGCFIDKGCKSRSVRPMFEDKSSDNICDNCYNVLIPSKSGKETCSNLQIPSKESSAGKETSRFCAAPTRSVSIDDDENECSLRDQAPSINCSISCDAFDREEGEILTDNDSCMEELVSAGNCCLSDVVTKPSIAYKRRRFSSPGEKADGGKPELEAYIKAGGANFGERLSHIVGTHTNVCMEVCENDNDR